MNSHTTAFDLTAWTWVRLTGRDAHKFLHNFCTNDILKLPQTRGCEAFVTNVKARVLGHIFAFDTGDESTGSRIDVLSFPGQDTTLLVHLDRYHIREDVTLEGRSEQVATILLTGDDAATLLNAATGAAVGTWKPFQSELLSLAGQKVRCFRLDLLGQRAFLVESSRGVAGDVRSALETAGAVGGDAATFEFYRIEAALPIYGVDVSEDQLAPEVGRPWAISYTKGCYLGQEPIARIDALGHVNRLLRGLQLQSDVNVKRGDPIIAEGKEIGTVTSAAPGRAIGYLRSKFAEPGTAVSIRTSAGDVHAIVYAPPAPGL